MRFALLGLGGGAVYAALALGLVLTYRASGVVNFAHGAMAMYATYVHVELSATGDLVLPVVGIPSRVHLLDRPPLLLSLVVALAAAALLALVVHAVVFRPLRAAPPLAGVVASVGLMVALQAVVTLQFGSGNRAVAPVLPAKPVRLLGLTVPADRLVLAGIVAVAAAGLWTASRFTRAGLATRAAAEDPTAAALLGLSPTALARANWVLAGVLAALGGILAAPVAGLNPATYTLLVVPALAAALVGRMASFGLTTAAALALGMAESALLVLHGRWNWLPPLGLSAGLPLLVVIVAVALGPGLRPGPVPPGRARGLPAAPRSRRVGLAAALGSVAAAVAVVALPSAYRLGLVHSMIGATVCLSLVVVTGYAAQISLAQMAFAGLAGFSLSRLGDGLGLPFPVAPVLAAALAGLVGLAVGVPALRTRGVNLALVTLAAAVAVEELVFKNAALTGGFRGSSVRSPRLFGVDLGIAGGGGGGGGGDYPRPAFGLLVLAMLVATAVGVARLRQGRLGRRLLAVRANERAAAVAGVAPAGIRLTAFALAAFLAGVGGTLVGYEQGQLSFESFGVFESLGYLAVAYLGGIASVAGALVGGALVPGGLVFTALDRLAGLGRYHLLASGVALTAVAVLAPEGIAGLGARMARRLGPARRRPPPPPAPGEWDGAETFPIRAPEGGQGAVLRVRDLSVRFGPALVLDRVSLDVRAGAVTGLVGPNGAGKTTLIDAVAGLVPAVSGSVRLGERDLGRLRPEERAGLGLARTFQALELFEDLSVEENLLVAAEGAGKGVGAADPSDLADLADDEWGRLPLELSHGRRQAVALARALASRPSVLLLDEPAAGLAAPERRQLAVSLRKLADRGLAVLLVDHDVGLVSEVCDDLVVLDRGRVLADGPPAEVRRDPAVVAAYLGQEREAPAPGEGRPDEGRATPSQPLLEARALVTGHAGVPVVHGVGLAVHQGEVVALLGPNGAGKTTTLMSLAGVLPALGGTVGLLGQPAPEVPEARARLGLALVPQDGGLFRELSVRENLWLAGPGRRPDVSAALDHFPALAPALDRPAGRLSGGEQRMLALARALLARPRVLLVDEVSLGLAPRAVTDLMAVLRRVADEEGTGVLLVEQHVRLALDVADRALVMDRGRIVLEGSAAELASRPDLVEASYLGDLGRG